MNDTVSALLWPLILIALWVLWTLFSDTSHQHGKWVAFLIPLFPIIWLLLSLFHLLAKLCLRPLFRLLGQEDTYQAMMDKVRIL